MKLRANKFVFYAIACFLSGYKYGHMVFFLFVKKGRFGNLWELLKQGHHWSVVNGRLAKIFGLIAWNMAELYYNHNQC